MWAHTDIMPDYPTVQAWPLETALIDRLVSGLGRDRGETTEIHGPFRRWLEP